MKGGDGGCEVFLSLGRNSSSSSEAVKGFDDSSSLPHMLSSLSRNGLSMLAGGASQIRSLRSGSNLAQQPSGKVCGGGFTGFYRTTRTHGASSSENHHHQNKAPVTRSSIAATAPAPARVKPDVENLSPDECWRLILKLGSRWPAWNGAPASSPQVPQDRNLEVEQDSLKVIASRALEALAQRPDRHSRPMLAPQKRTSTQEEAVKAKPILKPIVEEPASRELATPLKAVVSSTETRTETRTAPLTIFYAGTVNVCNDVPEDKARLIMLFAEKARVPPRDVSPECLISEEDAEVAPSASTAALEDVPESSPMSVKITISEGGKSRRQQGAAKPLPNARKNSLARFLDTRKRSRPSAAGSEGQKLSKKLSLGSDGCISDGEDLKSPNQLCSQSSFDSREGMRYNIMDAEMT